MTPSRQTGRYCRRHDPLGCSHACDRGVAAHTRAAGFAHAEEAVE